MNKSESRRLDKQLIRHLTVACEQAKSELMGFQWLTHEVDYRDFPSSLQVVWVFDTDAHMALALREGQDQIMQRLSQDALITAGVELTDIEQHVSFDTEQACQRSHGGDWTARLKADRPRRH